MNIQELFRNKDVTRFLMYATIGLLNTAVNWVVFLVLVYWAGVAQAIASLAAFLCAVTVSFFVNAKVTFESRTSVLGYVGYVAFLGSLALLVGAGSDRAGLSPFVTLIGFSALSLVVGFLFSRYVTFAESRPK